MSTENSSKIDWLTLTTWNMGAFFNFVAWYRRREPGGWKHGKVMQYSGMTNGSLFYGTAEQRNGIGETGGHGMVRVSGQAADDFFFMDWRWYQGDTSPTVWKCTRLDLESTRRPPKRHDLERAYKRIQMPKNLILGEKCTLYIGNRAESPIFTRLYEKLEYLRLEFELKHGRAKWAYQNLMAGTRIDTIYAAVLKKSRVPKLYADHYKPGATEVIDYSAEERKHDAKKRLAWLASIEATIAEMANDHDIGEKTRAIIERLASECARIDTETGIV